MGASPVAFRDREGPTSNTVRPRSSPRPGPTKRAVGGAGKEVWAPNRLQGIREPDKAGARSEAW